MKGFNVVLAAVIFVLAAASSVFSYFLYEKRANLVTGHSYFAKQITEATQKLESESGTVLSDKVNTETLRHDQPLSVMNDQLTEFNKLVSAVVAERDVLATTLVNVGNAIDFRKSKADYTKLASYKKTTAALLTYATNYRNRTNKIIESIVSSGQKLGTKSLSSGALKGASYQDAYKELDKRIDFWRNRQKAYENSVAQIAAALKGARPSNNENTYAQGLKTLVSHANTVYTARLEFEKKWKGEVDKVKSRDTQIANLKKEIGKLNNTIKAKDLDIRTLEQMMGIDRNRRKIKDGSAAALRLIRTQKKGKIMEVNGKFGFVVISLGKNTRVQDYYDYKKDRSGKREKGTWDVDPMIAEGMIFTIARDMPSGEAEYINKVKVVKVDDYCAIAEAMDSKTGKNILEDDFVYMADDQLEKWDKERK